MKKKTYPLDISALAYPLMKTRTAQSVFRYTAVMDKWVDPDALALSVEDILPNYPNFKSKVVCGFFWHKLRENDAHFPVKRDERPPLRPLRKEDTADYPFRIAYDKEEIIFEMFHAVADGNVGGYFFSDILTRYLERTEGEAIGIPERALTMTDAFLEYGRKLRLRELSVKRYNGKSVYPLVSRGNYEKAPRLLYKEVEVDGLKKKATDAGVTLTEYVASAYIAAALSEAPLPLRRSLALFIPVDLRRFFPSDTCQNFICFERIVIPKGTTDVSLPVILDEVKKQFREKFTKDRLQRSIDDVVTCFTLPVLAYIPLFVKSPCFRLVKKLMNKVRQTAILSNVGIFRLPPAAEAHVKSVKLFVNTSRNAPLNVGVMSYAGKLCATITCSLKNTDIPAKFFDLLRS